jgi:hypothetical protein
VRLENYSLVGHNVKVLVGKDDTQAYRGARFKRTMVTAVECISADGRCLDLMIIWPAGDVDIPLK